ncbi:MAG: hypothetical protein AB8G05_10670 [Oligoflexales bacterium]
MKIIHYLCTTLLYFSFSAHAQPSTLCDIKEIDEDADQKAETLDCHENSKITLFENVPSQEEISKLLNSIFPCTGLNEEKCMQYDQDFEFVEHGSCDDDGYFVVGAANNIGSSSIKQLHVNPLNIRKVYPTLGLFSYKPMFQTLGVLAGNPVHFKINEVFHEEKSNENP